MTKNLMSYDQCKPLHEIWGKDDCCLCNAKAEIAALRQRADVLEHERAEWKQIAIENGEEYEKMRKERDALKKKMETDCIKCQKESEDWESEAAALRQRAEAAEARDSSTMISLTRAISERDALQAENYNLRGELKEILEMVSAHTNVPLCEKIRHKIEGIPELEAK